MHNRRPRTCVSWQFTAPWSEVDKRVCDAPWRGSLCLFFLTKEKTCSTLWVLGQETAVCRRKRKGTFAGWHWLLHSSPGTMQANGPSSLPRPLGCVQALPAPFCQSRLGSSILPSSAQLSHTRKSMSPLSYLESFPSLFFSPNCISHQVWII